MKKVLFAICVVTLVFSLFACQIGVDGTTITSDLTELSAPSNVRVEDGMIYWSAVSNANRYIVQVGSENNQATTTELSYPLSSFRLNVGETYYVKVKALPSSGILYSESLWSPMYGPITIQSNTGSSSGSNAGSSGGNTGTPEKDPVDPEGDSEDAEVISENPVVVKDKETINKVKRYGIGFGYNFIEDEYFNQTKIRDNSILNIDKLLETAELRVQPLESFTQRTISGESIKEFAESLTSYYQWDTSMSAAYCGIVASISANIGSSSEYNYNNFSKGIFIKTTARKEQTNYKLTEYGNDLSAYLSDGFSDVIYKRGSFADYTDEQLIRYIYRVFGTHVLLGVKTGGSCDYYYTLVTNEDKVYKKFKDEISLDAKVDFVKFLSASSSFKLEDEYTTSEKNNDSHVDSHFSVVGGSTKDITIGNLTETLLSGWGASFNEENAVTIGVASHGAISIVDILRRCNLTDLANGFQAYLDKNATEQYNEICALYSLNTIVEKESDGIGTENDPYILRNDNFWKIKDDLSACYKLEEDIDLKNKTIEPIGTFTGVLNGADHSIKNFVINSVCTDGSKNSSKVALFIENRGTIKNLKIEDATIIGKLSGSSDSNAYELRISGLVAENYDEVDSCSLVNVSVIGEVSARKDWINYNDGILRIGGVAAYNNNGGTLKNCSVEKCIVKGVLLAETDKGIDNDGILGGIASVNYGTVLGCKVDNNSTLYLDVNGDGTSKNKSYPHARFGGIVGAQDTYSDAILSNCTIKKGNYQCDVSYGPYTQGSQLCALILAWYDTGTININSCEYSGCEIKQNWTNNGNTSSTVKTSYCSSSGGYATKGGK